MDVCDCLNGRQDGCNGSDEEYLIVKDFKIVQNLHIEGFCSVIRLL